MNASDTFEERLLSQLKHAVDEHPRRRPVRRRLLVGGGLAVTAAVAIAIPTLTAGTATAYEIERKGEAIVVDIKELTDAEGLEEALAEYGITSDVTYLPWAKKCADGHFTPVPPNPDMEKDWIAQGVETYDDGRLKSLQIEMPDFDKDDTLVIVVSPPGDGKNRMNLDFGGVSGVTAGPVGECEVVDVDPKNIVEYDADRK